MRTSESGETQLKTIATNNQNQANYSEFLPLYVLPLSQLKTRRFTSQVKTMGFESKHSPRELWVGINTLILSINALILICEWIRIDRQDVREKTLEIETIDVTLEIETIDVTLRIETIDKTLRRWRKKR